MGRPCASGGTPLARGAKPYLFAMRGRRRGARSIDALLPVPVNVKHYPYRYPSDAVRSECKQ